MLACTGADARWCAEPEKQFALVERHVAAIQARYEFRHSEIVVMVERNLGL
jgi:3-dehydroquinate dehydratase